MPKISIVTVCYNSEKTISQTFESLLEQTYREFEYIVIDGGSKDRTVEIIKNYSEKFLKNGIKFSYVSEKDYGIYDAMNKGIKLASGEIIGIINSDDWYEKDALENIITEYDKNEPDIIFGLLRTIGEDGNPVEIIGKYRESGVGVHPTVFVKRDIYEKYGVFNLKYKLAADCELLLRLSQKNVKTQMLEKIIANFRIDGATFKYQYQSTKEENEIRYSYGLISKKKKIINDMKNRIGLILKKYSN